jgi:hypothetical protein
MESATARSLAGVDLNPAPTGNLLENIDGGSLTDLGALAEPIRIEDGWFTPPAEHRPHA